jgi:hypothetical protein
VQNEKNSTIYFAAIGIAFIDSAFGFFRLRADKGNLRQKPNLWRVCGRRAKYGGTGLRGKHHGGGKRAD